MLEEKIDRLIETIETLTGALSGLGKVPAATKNVEPVTETTSDVSITQEELQDMCLAKVRKNKDNRVKITALIKEFGGTLIKDVDPAKFPELKKELEAL